MAKDDGKLDAATANRQHHNQRYNEDEPTFSEAVAETLSTTTLKTHFILPFLA
jgi:hypothetical protein